MITHVYLLAYVPCNDVVAVFRELILSEVEKKLKEWLLEVIQFIQNYVTKTWVGAPNKPPRYPREMWNKYEGTLTDTTNTNNAVESFNRSWNLSTGTKPSVWKIIRGVKREITLAKKKVDELERGVYVEPNPGRKAKVRRYHEKQRSILQTYCLKDIQKYATKMYRSV